MNRREAIRTAIGAVAACALPVVRPQYLDVMLQCSQGLSIRCKVFESHLKHIKPGAMLTITNGGDKFDRRIESVEVL